MHAFVALLFFLGLPFWEAKPPEKWTDTEITTILQSSPWVEATTGSNPGVTVYLATAEPIERAEEEMRTRSRKPLPLLDPDYLDYVRENREQIFILAIPYDKSSSIGKTDEIKRMEESTEMKIGRKSYKILGHFPPTATDPVLRLVFPRVVKPADKTVLFQLYVPGVTFPERDATFTVKDMLYHGKLEM